MTTFGETVLDCPNCGAAFSVKVLTGTDNSGGQTTDFRQVAAGVQPLDGFIHTCPRCGLTGAQEAFDEPVTATLAPFIAERLTPLVRDEPPHPWQRFEYAALIAKEQGTSRADIADLYLHAAWCCAARGTSATEENEKNYRRQAIDNFEGALARNEIESESKATITYLVGELYRRVGEPEAAATWFNAAIRLTAPDSEGSFLADLARRQMTAPSDLIEFPG
jgi:hypothetical protein